MLHQRHGRGHGADTGHGPGIALILARLLLLLAALLLQLQALHAVQAVGALGALHVAQPVALPTHAVYTDFGVEVGDRGHLVVGYHQVNAVVHEAAEQALNLGKGLDAAQVLAIHVDDLIAQTKAAVPGRKRWEWGFRLKAPLDS